MVDQSGNGVSPDKEEEVDVKPDIEVLRLGMSSGAGCSKPIQASLPSSSHSEVKSYFVGMGFTPTLVDKALEEHGEDNADLLLETLFTYSAIQKLSPETPNSQDGSFNLSESGTDSSGFSSGDADNEEVDVSSEVNADKRASLLMMNFTVQEVDFALSALGEKTKINELVDFIVAAQIAESSRKDEEITTETLFGTMDRTLRLLEMGFSEDEISSAIEKYGSDISAGELADSIFAKRIGDTCVENDKETNNWASRGCPPENHNRRRFHESSIAENGATNSYPTNDFDDMDFKNILHGKRPKHEYEDYSSTLPGPSRLEPETLQPKATSSFTPLSFEDSKQELPDEPIDDQKMTKHPNGPCRSIHRNSAQPPYFFYGNVFDVTRETWSKVSQYLYTVAPEFVNAQFFSALIRKEGYVHNLPKENRSPIVPKSPMTYQDAIPYTQPWWPSWDTRKQLSCITSETSGIPQICDRLRKMLIDSKGMISKEQQVDILHRCKTLNLVWVDEYKLSTIEPEQLERILGYPLNHTQTLTLERTERLRLLKHSFQTDTLGYHLSVLKRMFPNGLTMLSIYSGIGGAEVALHRLGIRLKCVVSVESSETNRKILKAWWCSTGQTGRLVQLEGSKQLSGHKLQALKKDYGCFDFIICQDPCTILRGSKSPFDCETRLGLDWSMFYEFNRILTRARAISSISGR